MAKQNNKQALVKKNEQQLSRVDVDELDVSYTKRNEATINVAGVKINVDLAEFSAVIRDVLERRAARKALKEQQKKKELKETVTYILSETEESEDNN